MTMSSAPLLDGIGGPCCCAHPPMNTDVQTERFIRCLTEHQSRLLAYLVALLGDLHEARNVLQDTNLELWRKSEDFVEGTDFAAWSRRVAHFKVLAYLRDKRRDRLLFDEALLSRSPSGHSRRTTTIRSMSRCGTASRRCPTASGS